jgi:hypothetical protein
MSGCLRSGDAFQIEPGSVGQRRIALPNIEGAADRQAVADRHVLGNAQRKQRQRCRAVEHPVVSCAMTSLMGEVARIQHVGALWLPQEVAVGARPTPRPLGKGAQASVKRKRIVQAVNFVLHELGDRCSRHGSAFPTPTIRSAQDDAQFGSHEATSTYAALRERQFVTRDRTATRCLLHRACRPPRGLRRWGLMSACGMGGAHPRRCVRSLLCL